MRIDLLPLASPQCLLFVVLQLDQAWVLPVWSFSWPLQVKGNMLAGESLSRTRAPGFPSCPTVLSLRLLPHSPVRPVTEADQSALCPGRRQPPLWVGSGCGPAGLSSAPASSCRGGKDLLLVGSSGEPIPLAGFSVSSGKGEDACTLVPLPFSLILSHYH